MKRPDFFIVGAPRCGTTAMYGYLKAHPEIFMSAQKELYFFGRDTTNGPKPAIEEYLSNFSMATDEKRAGEASVIYLSSRWAAEEIKEFNPSSRIIIMLRNPVDFLYSFHSLLLYIGDEDIADFEAALKAEKSRREGKQIPARTRMVNVLYYRHMAKFSEQVQRYFDGFGRERVFIILLEDLEDNPLQVYRDTLEFLDVSKEFQPDFKIINANQRTRNGFLHRFITDRQTSVFKRFGQNSAQSRALRKLTGPLRRWNRFAEPRPPMDPVLREHLRDEFAPEVEQLGELLGRDLTHWSRE